MLKLKAFIYKKTGIYLAHKEENDYINSYEYWEQFEKFLDPEVGLTLAGTHGLVIGVWQANNGFTRPLSRLGGDLSLFKKRRGL